jgi:hypothetical protein
LGQSFEFKRDWFLAMIGSFNFSDHHSSILLRFNAERSTITVYNFLIHFIFILNSFTHSSPKKSIDDHILCRCIKSPSSFHPLWWSKRLALMGILNIVICFPTYRKKSFF